MSAISRDREARPTFLHVDIPSSSNISATSTPRAPRTRKDTFVLSPEEVSRISHNNQSNNNDSNREKSDLVGQQDDLLTDDDEEDDEPVFQARISDPQLDAQDVSISDAGRVLQPETLASRAYLEAPTPSKRAVIRYMQLRRSGLLKYNGYTYARTISHVPAMAATLPPDCPMPCLLPYQQPGQAATPREKVPRYIPLRAPVKRLQKKPFIKSLFNDCKRPKLVCSRPHRTTTATDRASCLMAFMLLAYTFGMGTLFGGLLSFFNCH